MLRGKKKDMVKLLSRSFELVYHDPSSESDGRTYFNEVEGAASLDLEQRIAYLEEYARAMREFFKLGEDYLSYPSVTPEEVRQRLTGIKEKPLPSVRKVTGLRYWRWKLPKEDGTDAETWYLPETDDSTWNELETPRLFVLNSPVYLITTVSPGQFKRAFLDIESIVDAYRVYINGREFTRHDGFEPVRLDVSSALLVGGENAIAILVEGQHEQQVGIAGEINLVLTDDLVVRDLFVRPRQIRGEHEASVDVEVTVENKASGMRRAIVEVGLTPWYPAESAEAQYIFRQDVTVDGSGARMVRFECELDGVDLWWPDDPHLYKVTALLRDENGNTIDDHVETTGIRTIQQRDGKIYLNNREHYLKGFVANPAYPFSVGSHSELCPPDEWLVMDLLLCKNAGGNAIRWLPWGSGGARGEYHENGVPTFLDVPKDGTNYERMFLIADQLGICMTAITRCWRTFARGYMDAGYWAREDLARLLVPSIKRIRNHPSVIIYEGLNEVGMCGFQPNIHVYGKEGFSRIENAREDERNAVRDEWQQSYLDSRADYIDIVNSVDDTKLVTPDSPWGPAYQPYRPQFVQVPEDLHLRADNSFWELHEFPGWYSDLADLYLKAKELAILSDKRRPLVVSEIGLEAMPDWSRYRGYPWHGVWANNFRFAGEFDMARIGRPLRILRDSEAHLSQAYQALCLHECISFFRSRGASGTMITYLADGGIEGCYRKGVNDLFRRSKLGHFAVKTCYQDPLVTGRDGDFVLSATDALKLTLCNNEKELVGRRANLVVRVRDEKGKEVSRHETGFIFGEGSVQSLGQWQPEFPGSGLYRLEYEVFGEQDVGSA